MSCPSPLICSMYVDGALAASDAAEIDKHLSKCSSCATLVAALARESRMLREVLQNAKGAIAIPKFRPPLRVLDLLVFGMATAAMAWLSTAFWAGIAEWVPSGLHWLNPLHPGELLDSLISVIVYLSREGIAMIATTIDSIGAAALSAMLAVGLFSTLKKRAGSAALLSVLLLAIIVPSLGHAIEIRRGEGLMSVAASETVDDTLVVFGESVSIDGNINGDLVAFARSVTVRGEVTGDLIAFAETVTVEGRVTGNTFGFGRAVVLSRAQVGGNLYGFGRDVTVGTDARVGGNATMFGNSTAMRGRVGVDLLSFAGEVQIGGEVVRNAEVHAGRVTVLAPARIGGNLTAHIGNEDNLQTAPGAVIAGATDSQISEDLADANRYLTASFYMRQAMRLGAAFLAGLIALWAFPALRTATLTSGAHALKAAGIGLILAVTLPVFAVIACITIVGIPLGIIGVIAWILGLYFAKIVAAVFIGRTLFASPSGLPHHAAFLLAGLVVVLIAVNLPYVGGLLNIALTLTGLGMITTHFLRRWTRRNDDGLPSAA